VIAVETAHEHGRIAKTVAGVVVMDEFQNFARCENDLGVGVWTGNNPDGFCLEFRLQAAGRQPDLTA